MNADVLSALSLSLGIGLLVGLQRERVGSRIGGIRTFPLIALFGVVCGFLTYEWGGLVFAAGTIAVATLVVLANRGELREGEDAGQTSEAAALLTYALGGLFAAKFYAAGIVAGGVLAVLLHYKQPMHRFAGGMSEKDVMAVMRFVIISLVVLPVLPDRTFGKYDVINPREIWWMVVLIVGIGLSGYVSSKVFTRASVILGGVLGGLISSTATTVAYARRAMHNPAAATLAAVTIGIAWTVSVVRMMIEVVVVAPGLAARMLPPLSVVLAAMVVAVGVLYFSGKSQPAELPEQDNPAEMQSALIFAFLYALVLFGAAAGKHHFGDEALYAVALISGVVDVDAITLSTAQLAVVGRIDESTAWRVILTAAMSNLIFKAAAAVVLGSMHLFVRLLPVVGAGLAAGIFVLLFWSW